jgi:hypothetical protein
LVDVCRLDVRLVSSINSHASGLSFSLSRDALTGSVEAPMQIGLKRYPRKAREVADINHLDMVGPITGCQHLPTRERPLYPVGELIMLIMRPDNPLWAEERTAVSVDLVDDGFAGDFERAIGIAGDIGYIFAVQATWAGGRRVTLVRAWCWR